MFQCTDLPTVCMIRCILCELDEPIFNKLYSQEWESGENLSHILVVTLADYLTDLEAWLPEDYFKVFVKELMTTLVEKYVMCLRRRHGSLGSGGHHHNSNSNATDKNKDFFTFTSELNAANRVLTDRIVMQEFFETHMCNDAGQGEGKCIYKELS